MNAKLVHVIPSLLSQEECQELIHISDFAGFKQQFFGVSPNRELRRRVAVDKVDWAQTIWIRLQSQLRDLASYYDPQFCSNSEVNVSDYFAIGINERLRFYKYFSGERFSKHSDLSFEKNENERSMLSVVIYLNDDFEGGATRFETGAVTIRQGTGVVFAHELKHEGLPVTSGVKRVLRTDVMVRKRWG